MKKETAISKEMITQWKAEHGKIFESVIDDERYIWKKLKRKDFVEIMSQFTDEDSEVAYMKRQDLIAIKTVIYPSNIEELIEENAFLSKVLSEEVLAHAGLRFEKTQEL